MTKAQFKKWYSENYLGTPLYNGKERVFYCPFIGVNSQKPLRPQTVNAIVADFPRAFPAAPFSIFPA